MSWWRRGPTHGEVVRWVARCDKIPKQPVMRGGGGRLTCHISADASSWRRTHDRDLRPTEGGGSLLRLAGSLRLPCFQFWVRSLAGEESWRNSRGVLGAIFCLVGQPRLLFTEGKETVSFWRLSLGSGRKVSRTWRWNRDYPE
ncbi:hypothetical protein OPV22_010587 [Ensete ventricosum]|uniref:Uncharacterized protein n=1 Tax=Ensete ventricosum TaxID=4639 RepID=A0AAV8PUW1_ENSVE|nr:hypothetical protein OPV22_010587 [Ensete ventricosum]